MSKYFAKLFPVENGDWVRYSMLNSPFSARYSDKFFIAAQTKGFNPIRAKLFLCTLDIKPGDTVKTCKTKDDYWKNDEGTAVDPILTSYPCEGVVRAEGDLPSIWMIDYGEFVLPIPKSFCIKVIGEISPEAGWVKESDEFDDYIEMALTEHGLISQATDAIIMAKRNPEWMKVVAGIRCPTCKNFH